MKNVQDDSGGINQNHNKSDTNEKTNPNLSVIQRKKGGRPGDDYIKTNRPFRRFFRGSGNRLVATPESYSANSFSGRVGQFLKTIFIGKPLSTTAEIQERLTKFKALAVFGSDAISSSAYATEAALVVLVVAGSGALNISMWISLAIALILSIVAFCYRQMVYAYPQGGGAYNVSRYNLGKYASLVASSALLVDYIMTVAVSVAAGSLAVTSALMAAGYGNNITAIDNMLPPFLDAKVLLSIFFIGLIVLGNLRGLRESGSIFSIPTYLFIISLIVLLLVGLFKLITGNLVPSTSPSEIIPAAPITMWLVLRSFAAGAVAMSGTEAISDGVPAFKPPESKNAATTLTIMATLLGVFFVGVSFLATQLRIIPGEQSVISQVALSVFGQNAFYYVFQIATMGILVIAANTAFADFPRLSSFLARDNFMPHAFLHRGDRLAFSTGIIFLGVVAGLLLTIFRGNVDSLIHLYAVGVFLAFSLSNTGMVVHWWKTRGRGWLKSLFINGIGAIITTGILLIVLVTKFAYGAWIVVVLIPAIVVLFLMIRRHYDAVEKHMRPLPAQIPPAKIETKHTIVPIADVNIASLRAMSFARTQCEDIVVLHIFSDAKEAEKIQEKMKIFAPDLKLVTIESPLRSIIPPLVTYIDLFQQQHPTAFTSIIMPELVTTHWWERFLHNRVEEQLTDVCKKHQNVAVILVPYTLRN
jgi:amino acid transporter